MQPVSAGFTDLIPRKHTRAARVSWVSLNGATGEFETLGVLTGPGGVVFDGAVTIDRRRVVRRTADLAVVLDKLGSLTPDAPGDPFYLFSMLKLERGVVVDGSPEYVDLGYFVVDRPSSSFSTRSGGHRLALADRFTLATEARLLEPLSFGAEERVGEVIRAFAELAGLGSSDLLYSIDDGGASLGFERAYEWGDSIPDAMVSLVSDHGLDLYMNAQSVMILEPFRDPTTLPTSYSFAGGPEAVVTEITKELSAAGWYNVTSAIGEGPDLVTPIIGVAEVTDPLSPSHYSKIGVRVKPPRISAQIRTQAQATSVALSDLYDSALEEARITGSLVAHPALETGDLVSMDYPRAKLDDKFVLDIVRHPLRDGTSSFETRRVRNLVS